MKHLIKATLLLLALLLPTHTHAHDFEVDGIYYNINGTNATVTFRGTYFYQYSNAYSGSVTIPTTVTYGDTTYSVTSIGSGAFRNCSSLNDVYCYATTPPECIYDVDFYTTFTNYSVTLHVPAASLAAYKTAPEWSKFKNIVGDAIAPTGIAISRDSVEIQSGE